MKPFKYESTQGMKVIIKPDNPMTLCEIYYTDQLASYGFSTCKEGDVFSLEIGMRKAFESALKRVHSVKDVERIPRKYWVGMYKDFNEAFRPWYEKYLAKYAKEMHKTGIPPFPNLHEFPMPLMDLVEEWYILKYKAY